MSLQSDINSIKNAQGYLFSHLAQKALNNLVKKLSVCENVSQLCGSPMVAMFFPYPHVGKWCFVTGITSGLIIFQGGTLGLEKNQLYLILYTLPNSLNSHSVIQEVLLIRDTVLTHGTVKAQYHSH